MKPVLACAVVVLLAIAPLPSIRVDRSGPAIARADETQYQIDLTRYFASPEAEAQSRVQALTDAKAFAASGTPRTAGALLRWLKRYDALLKTLERHDIFVYLRAEEDDRDTADAQADDRLAATEDLISNCVMDAAQQLGSSHIQTLTAGPALRPYRYLLINALAQAAHRLTPAEARSVALAVTPVLDSASSTYKALRKSKATIESNQETYAALLIAIAGARNGVARLRGFSGAAEASYFDKAIDPASVARILAAVRGSNAFAHYRDVAAKAPKPEFSAPPIAISDAIPLILAAEQPMGTQYASAYAQLLDPANRRFELCTERECDPTGFSVGFSGADSGVYYGGYDGRTKTIRAVAHESGHAVHRQFMARYQPIAAYNRGPAFMFESFAIFNELLFLDHLYRAAAGNAERAYYLNYFVDDATFQIYGSAEETELESAIYRGVDAGNIRTASDLDAFTSKIFAQYDPAAAQNPTTRLYWARDRLFFTDPLYDVNYLYAGLLALTYFTMYERAPQAFSSRYVALLENGFNDSPAALQRRFLGIDLTNERGLVDNASSLIEARTQALAMLYSSTAPPR